MYCGKCGKENADGTRFCIHCGVDLASQTPESASKSSAADETVEDTGALAAELLDVAGPADTGQKETPKIVPMEPMRPGTMLAGRYKIDKRLGAGGMGEVFKATDAELNDMVVAIKVLPPILAVNIRSINRLRTEAAIALRLTHPNICRLHSFSADGNTKFLVMEFMPGETLEEMIDATSERRIEIDKLLPIADNVAAALDFAHSLKPPILHRDIKPSNVMVSPNGIGKVLDFGIARELKDSMTRMTGKDTSGTLLYMSPEQFTGGSPHPASDVYSLTAMIYECLASHPPFWQGSIAHQLLNQKPARVDGLSDHVNDALQAGLAKNAGERPKSARALVRMLAGKVDAPAEISGTFKPPTVAAQDRPKKRAASAQVAPRGKKGILVWVMLLLVALVGVGWVGIQQEWWPEEIVAALGLGKPPATLDMMVRARQSAQAKWDQVKNVTAGPGLSDKLGSVPTLMDIAKGIGDREEFTKACDKYNEAEAMCEDIERADKQRNIAKTLQKGITPARKDAQASEAPTLAVALWQGAEGASASAQEAFDTGDFDKAIVSWQAALKKYATSQEYALAAAEIGRVRKEYEDALTNVDLDTVKKYGGAAWRHTEASVKAARKADISPQAIKDWEDAKLSLTEAWKLATAEKAAWDKVDAHIAQARKLLAASRFAEASTQIQAALAVKPGFTDAKLLAIKIDTTLIMAQATQMKVNDPVGALTKIIQADTKLAKALEMSPKEAWAVAMSTRANLLRSELESLYRIERRILGHDDMITSAAFDPTGDKLVTCSWDNTLKVWNVSAGSVLRTIEAADDVSSVAWSSKGTLAWSVGPELFVLRSDMPTEHRKFSGHLLAIVSIAFSPSGAQVATGSEDNTLRVWDVKSGKTVAEFKHDQDVKCVAYSPDGKSIVSAGEDGYVRIWDIATGKLSASLRHGGGLVSSVVYSPNGKRLASAGTDKIVRIWDVASGANVISLVGHSAPISSLTFRPDGKRLASAGGNEVRLWNLDKRQCAQLLNNGHGRSDWVRVVRFSANGRYMVSAGDEKVIVFWAQGLKASR